MPPFRFPILLALFVTLAGNPAQGQNQHEEHRHDASKTGLNRGQETHVHGVAMLLVILEGAQLDIELRSPAINLLGFEHKVSTAKHRSTVENTKTTLTDTSRLFQFKSAGCQLIDHHMDFSSVLEPPYHPTEKHSADHHDKHPKAHDHSDINIHYRYRCEHPDKLYSLSARIVDEFPGIQSLQVQWIVNGRQGATTLDSGQHRLILNR